MAGLRADDIKSFVSYYPAFSALALVDTEPNDHVIEVLKGYLALRKAARGLLEPLRVSEEVISYHTKMRPNIVVSINELVAAGRNRDQLRKYCGEQGVDVINHSDSVWQYHIPPFGKNTHLSVALIHSPGPYIFLADARVSDQMATELFVEYLLGGMAAGFGLFFWESRADQRPHFVIASKGLLNSDYLLNKDNDRFRVHKTSAWWGGFQFKGWTPAEPKKKLKFDRAKDPTNVYEKNHPYTLQELIDGFFYEASRRDAGPKRVHVSYGLYS
jgi:hypothetical protein